MLGMLYNKTLNKPAFQKAPPGQSNLAGLSGSESNLDPNNGNPVTVWGTNDDPTNLPVIDPGESFYDMSQQILGLPLVPVTKNHYPSAPPLTSPTDGYGLAGGYVANFAVQNLYGNPLKNVMHSYLPSRVPVTSYLAHNFMVCDQWFASAPTQTFANRLFSLCANPGSDHHGSFIDDLQYGTSLVSGLSLPSVFDLLDLAKAGKGIVPNWKLYFHDVSYGAILLKKVGDLFASTSNENVGNYNNVDYPPGSSYANPLTHPTNTFIEDVQKNAGPVHAHRAAIYQQLSRHGAGPLREQQPSGHLVSNRADLPARQIHRSTWPSAKRCYGRSTRHSAAARRIGIRRSSHRHVR